MKPTAKMKLLLLPLNYLYLRIFLGIKQSDSKVQNALLQYNRYCKGHFLFAEERCYGRFMNESNTHCSERKRRKRKGQAYKIIIPVLFIAILIAMQTRLRSKNEDLNRKKCGMGSGERITNKRIPLICGGIVFIAAFAAFAAFLIYGLVSVPDISVLGKIASGEKDVPVTNLLGQEFFVYHSPQYGENIPVQLSDISDEMIAMTIATEDSRFFTNPGFSPAAILRAVLQNLHFRQTYSGASTITQQLVKNILIPEDKRFERSLSRKAMEIYLAAAVTSCYDKETILTLYLNEIYYGRYACGVEKAAEVYFGKHASELDLSEAAFIAGLPQAPNYYGNDPAAGARRQREVLRIAERETRDGRCIPLGSGKNARQYCPGRDAIELALEK